MIIITSREERELLSRLREIRSGANPIEAAALSASIAQLTAQLDVLQEQTTLQAEVVRLKTEISDLTIQRDKLDEDFSRRERDLRHAISLEKSRQEQERASDQVRIDQARAEAKLDVREEALNAAQQQFKDQLDFQSKYAERTEKFLRESFDAVLSRLPDVSLRMRDETRNVTRRTEKRRGAADAGE